MSDSEKDIFSRLEKKALPVDEFLEGQPTGGTTPISTVPGSSSGGAPPTQPITITPEDREQQSRWQEIISPLLTAIGNLYLTGPEDRKLSEDGKDVNIESGFMARAAVKAMPATDVGSPRKLFAIGLLIYLTRVFSRKKGASLRSLFKRKPEPTTQSPTQQPESKEVQEAPPSEPAKASP